MLIYQGLYSQNESCQIVDAAEAWNLCHGYLNQISDQISTRDQKAYQSMGHCHKHTGHSTYIDQALSLKETFVSRTAQKDENAENYFHTGIVFYRTMRRFVKKNNINKKLIQSLLKNDRLEKFTEQLRNELNDIQLAIHHYQEKKTDRRSTKYDNVIAELNKLKDACETLLAIFYSQECRAKLQQYNRTELKTRSNERSEMYLNSSIYNYYNQCETHKEKVEQNELKETIVEKTRSAVLAIPKGKYSTYKLTIFQSIMEKSAEGLTSAINNDYKSGILKKIYYDACIHKIKNSQLTIASNSHGGYIKI